MRKPPPGTMVYYRLQSLIRSPNEIRDNEWRFGYCTWLADPDLIRMGRWNGDNVGGSILSVEEVVWRPYK